VGSSTTLTVTSDRNIGGVVSINRYPSDGDIAGIASRAGVTSQSVITGIGRFTGAACMEVHAATRPTQPSLTFLPSPVLQVVQVLRV
jgi:hypothetical protein